MINAFVVIDDEPRDPVLLDGNGDLGEGSQPQFARSVRRRKIMQLIGDRLACPDLAAMRASGIERRYVGLDLVMRVDADIHDHEIGDGVLLRLRRSLGSRKA